MVIVDFIRLPAYLFSTIYCARALEDYEFSREKIVSNKSILFYNPTCYHANKTIFN